jgi:hypothetical protein
LHWYVKDFSRVEITEAALKYIEEEDEQILTHCGEGVGKRIVEEKHRILGDPNEPPTV